jgi:hypothetical protein
MTNCPLCDRARREVVGEYQSTRRCCRLRYLLLPWHSKDYRRATLERWSVQHGPDEAEATRADVVAAWNERVLQRA